MNALRLLVIGLDGATLDVIAPRAATGMLPTFSRLLRDGAWGTTTTTWPAHTGPGWPTLLTGASPGGHGVFGFFENHAPGYAMEIVRADSWETGSLLNRLARRGVKVGCMNVPMSHPPSGELEFELTWPLEESLRFSWPKRLAAELQQAGAPFHPDLHTMYTGQEDYPELARANVERRLTTFRHLRKMYPDVEVAMLVLTEPDRVSHHFWVDDPFGLPGGDAVTDVYQHVDAAIAALLEDVPDECPVLFVSDHGFGTGGPQLALNSLLHELGWLRAAQDDRAAAVAPWYRGDRGGVDWEHTLAYAPTPGGWGVNLNLIGRQSSGTVRRRDADHVLSDLAEALIETRVPDGSRPALRAVIRTTELYPGPGAARGPDLLLIPADERFGMNATLHGDVWVANPQVATHRFVGFWGLLGTNMRAGEYMRTPLESVLPSALDVAGPGDIKGEVVEGAANRFEPLSDPVRQDIGATKSAAGDELFRIMRSMGYA